MAENGVGEDPEGLHDVGLIPERLTIVDLSDPEREELQAQFNPTEFDEVLKVDWAKLASPGLSYRRLHYVGTDNPELSVDLVFDAGAEAARNGDYDTAISRLKNARTFLQSLCVPRQGATSVRDGQAPRVLFKWPNFMTLTCVIGELSFRYERFHNDGRPTRFTVKVKLERIIAEDGIPPYSELVRGDFF